MTVKDQLKPKIDELATRPSENSFGISKQIDDMIAQMTEKNKIIQNLMSLQEHQQSQMELQRSELSSMKSWLDSKIAKNQQEMDDIKKENTNLRTSMEFQSSNIDNLQQEIESQLQINSNLELFQSNLQKMEKEFKAAIVKADPEKLYNKEMLVMNINQNKKITKLEEALEGFKTQQLKNYSGIEKKVGELY